MIPITAIVINIPIEKINDITNERDVVFISFLEVKYPIIRGILARWHGESKMLRIPHAKELMPANR